MYKNEASEARLNFLTPFKETILIEILTTKERKIQPKGIHDF